MRLVLVTRPSPDARLATLLRERGFETRHVPAIATEPVASPDLDEALRDLSSFDWVVLTSATGVRAVIGAAARIAVPLPAEPPRWAAVGPATAGALADARLPVAATPADARGAAIPDALAAIAPLAGTRILLPRASAADESLPDSLRAAGAEVVEVIAYRTVEGPEESCGPLDVALRDPALGAIVFASGSAVRGVVRLASGSAAAARLASIPIVSIGPSTSAEVRRFDLRLAAEAAQPTPESLADAVSSALGVLATLASAETPR